MTNEEISGNICKLSARAAEPETGSCAEFGKNGNAPDKLPLIGILQRLRDEGVKTGAQRTA